MSQPIVDSLTAGKDETSDDIFFDTRDNPISIVKHCTHISGENDNNEFSSEVIPKILPLDEVLCDVSYFLHSNAREKLPGIMSQRNFSIWSYVKEFVGRDLTKITLPVHLNEPLSTLQKVAENLSYSGLLRKMMAANDPVTRLEYLAAFFAICRASSLVRHFKPFNPILGETYEMRNYEKGLHFVCEQVSHHPPIIAIYFELPRLRCHGSFQQNIRFWGNTADVFVIGTMVYEFLDCKGNVESVITLKTPTTSVRNIIIGNVWLERHGIAPIIDHTTGHRVMLNFKKKGWFSNRDQHMVEGTIVDSTGKQLRCVYGNWTTDIWSCSPETFRRIKINPSLSKGPDSTLLIKAIPQHPNSHLYFNMPRFEIAMNEVHGSMNLPPTDSRLRPDIRYLEEGDLDRASAEKHRLEDKQRAAKKYRDSTGEPWVPLWFVLKQNPVTNEVDWEFNHKYFEQNFEHCPDLF